MFVELLAMLAITPPMMKQGIEPTTEQILQSAWLKLSIPELTRGSGLALIGGS